MRGRRRRLATCDRTDIPWRKRLATYRDRAVVLRKLDYGEADRIFTLLTRTHGKVGAIAKGVRRPESKLGPSLELYGHVDVLLAKGRGDLDVVAQVERLPGTRMAGARERPAPGVGLVPHVGAGAARLRATAGGVRVVRAAAARQAGGVQRGRG